jgi:hypothetical protein
MNSRTMLHLRSSNVSNPAPDSVRLAVRLGWLLVVTILAITLWPYWRQAAAVFPADTNWIARSVALLVASLFLMFTPVLIGQLVAAVCLLFLARRQGWARMVFLAGTVASVMVTIADMVGKANTQFLGLLYIQLLLVLLQLVLVTLLFKRESTDWFRSRQSLQTSAR